MNHYGDSTLCLHHSCVHAQMYRCVFRIVDTSDGGSHVFKSAGSSSDRLFVPRCVVCSSLTECDM